MRRIIDRAGWAVAGALALAVIAIASRAVQGGPLDPPGVPGSTMRTLGDLVPAWDQTLTSNGCGSQRWTCVLGGGAVLDNETGLVWEKTPIYNGTDSWTNAVTLCTSDSAGGRFGWRLPSSEELLSLKDPSIGNIVANAPFTDIDGHSFWTSTAATDDDAQARYISFSMLASNEQSAPKTLASIAGIWCVRGGQSEARQIPNGLTTWSRKLSALGLDSCNSERFTCVMDGTGVLDHETGLVWQRVPEPAANQYSWSDAFRQCQRVAIGGRLGWRLPSAEEFRSLATQNGNAYTLPPGNPFTAPQGTFDGYWTSTTSPNNAGEAEVSYPYNFTAPDFTSDGTVVKSAVTPRAWCVRGPGSDGM